MSARKGCFGLLTGCLIKLVLWGTVALAAVWLFTIALNPWALHIGGRSTPFLYWHGTGTVLAKDGKSYPLYVTFWPGEPRRHSGGRREGKGWSANLRGTGWLCIAPGKTERMDISGTMYGGYLHADQSLFSFRLLEWPGYFRFSYPHRGFFDLAGMWHGQELVMDRPNEQGIKLNTGPFIDRATVTLHYADKSEYEAVCAMQDSGKRQ
ncbi:MAG: hypothetical protein KGN79_05125 [Acidobacteriota bacterium]|nr:hypothetical protein [Acidobacteriota bacterium]